VLGYSKLDLMFGHTTLDAVRMPCRNFVKPGVNFRQEIITAIDPTRGASPPMPEPMRPTSWFSVPTVLDHITEALCTNISRPVSSRSPMR
jgi:hypothetical protein